MTTNDQGFRTAAWYSITASRKVVVLISLFVLLYVLHFRLVREIWGSAVIMDGVGYFAYLPYVFETGATSFSGYCDFSGDEPCGPFFMRGPAGASVDKYYAGCSILWSPFYLTARFYEWLTGVDGNGYSKTTFVSIALAGWFYLTLGLVVLRRSLAMLQINDSVIALSLLLITFFTNVFWYAAREPSMSHIYSFALFCLFIYALLRWKQKPTSGAAGIYLLLGLIALVRPTNILVVLFVPAFLNPQQIRRLFSAIKYWPLFALVVFVQPLFYFLQTGHWWLWSYEGESFDFSQPHIINTWFGPQKGLAIYFPVFMLIILTAIWWAYKHSISAIKTIVPAILVFYILSSWHAWQYGWSFGIRAYIEFYPLLFMPLVFWLNKYWTVTRNRILIGIILLPCLAVTLMAQSAAMSDYALLQDMTWPKWKELLFSVVTER